MYRGFAVGSGSCAGRACICEAADFKLSNDSENGAPEEDGAALACGEETEASPEGANGADGATHIRDSVRPSCARHLQGAAERKVGRRNDAGYARLSVIAWADRYG
jgi:hypothetical protein